MQPVATTVPSDANSLPPELLETPQPVIGFIGLDCSKNLVHKSIWDAFNTNRKADRAAIQFKLLPSNYEIPIVKPKRQSYEWYHPKGILKRNWILKHLHVLPAVIVLFQDLEWNDPEWTEKQYQCVSFMQAIKAMTQGRHTKLAIVLLQRGIPSSGDEATTNDRLSILASKCDMNQKMIFVLPYNDHLTGYTLRLESGFLEQAQSYYAQSSKQVRMHRDQLTSSHLELKIRHQFKLGFYAEMRIDLNTALKHYCQAYEWLEEIRIVDTNCLEMKVVAGFLSYKICKLMFNINSPRDAITQFRTHIEKYKNRCGFKDLIFEHYAWLSVQYSVFAELFCDAIKCGLPALQTQHPGIYYHKAAEYISKRKEAFQQCRSASSPLLDFLPLTEQNSMNYSNILYSDFFGVRGGNRTSEPINDQQIIAIVQECERCVNHSAICITLLGQAMAQFKIYKCLRFRKKLAIDMAEEYLKTGDASKALTLYSLMLSDYRVEKWNTIFSQVLLKTLRSAFLSASVADFISCSLECLSTKIIMEHNERIHILENLWKVFQKVPPMTQSQIVPELRYNWETALASFSTKLTFDLDKFTKLFECMVIFDKCQIPHDELVQVNLYIRSMSDVPLKIREFIVILSSTRDSKSSHQLNASQWMEVNEVTEVDKNAAGVAIDSDFMIQPNQLYRILFLGERFQFVENVELKVNRLEIKMGIATNSITLIQSSSLNPKASFKSYNRKNDGLHNVSGAQSCYIIPTFHLSTETLLSYKAMLTNEYFKITTRIENDQDIVFESVSLIVTVPPHLRNKVFLSPDVSKSKQKILSQFHVDIGAISPKTSKTIYFHVISLVEGTLELSQLIRYQTANSNRLKCSNSTENESNGGSDGVGSTQILTNAMQNHNVSVEYVDESVIKSKRETIVIPCSTEFIFSGKLYSLNKEALTKAYKYEDFLFRVELEIKSVDIDILDMFLISDYNITEKPYAKSRRTYGQTFSKGAKIHEVRLLHAEQTTQNWINRTEYQNQKSRPKVFGVVKHHRVPTIESHATPKPGYDAYQNNLLSKISMTSSITSPINSTPLNRSLTDDFKAPVNATNMSSNENISNQENAFETGNAPIPSPKLIYQNAIDSFTMIGNRKGFLATNSINCTETSSELSNQSLMGIYCVRWRRTGAKAENETKLFVSSIEIVDAPLNLYCYFDEKMYVKVPMTLTISLKNSTNATIHLKSYLKNADNFMFAGHTQLNISLFAQSTYDLHFNLYPLKAGWQQLPEFEIKYNTPDDVVPEKRAEEQLNNLQLQKLVRRWMPKKVFILPMVRQI